jgi:hypothetical protein
VGILDQMLFSTMVLVAYLGPPASILWGWSSAWRAVPEPKWRSRLGFVALSAASLLAIGYLFALLHLGAEGDFGAKVNFWLRWSKVGVRISALIVAASLFAKGRSRVASILCACSLILLSAIVYMTK